MKVKDILCRMPPYSLVTVKDFKTEEVLIDCDTCDRICAFDEVDEDIHRIFHSDVIKIERGRVFDNLILSILR